MSVLNINIEELLKELDPATLQALEQLLAEDAPAVRKNRPLGVIACLS